MDVGSQKRSSKTKLKSGSLRVASREQFHQDGASLRRAVGKAGFVSCRSDDVLGQRRLGEPGFKGVRQGGAVGPGAAADALLERLFAPASVLIHVSIHDVILGSKD